MPGAPLLLLQWLLAHPCCTTAVAAASADGQQVLSVKGQEEIQDQRLALLSAIQPLVHLCQLGLVAVDQQFAITALYLLQRDVGVGAIAAGPG